ncbi:MAG: MFS transporter [Candidatus Peribacteraceae bacterium]|nr:MFS transporter [Candidatus Peribacteraceae bacterium]MDD5742189.1 MFS transporter [Candidatus Peribacteraceae bacterium]
MESPPPSPQYVKRTVWTFASASFLHDMGADMIFSIWPMFLTTVLGANMAVVGLIDGLGDAFVSIAQAVSGYLSDRLRKRKPFVWMGYFFGGIAKVGYSLAPTWHWVLPFRILDRSGKMRGAPRDAIVSDLSTVQNRGRHFGILRMMDYSGAMIGIIAAIVLVRFLPIRTIILISAIPSMFAVVLVISIYHEKKPDGTKVFKGIHLTDFSGRLRLYTILNALFVLGSFSYSFLLLSAKSSGFTIGEMPVLYLLYTVVAAILSMFFGKLADRIGRKWVLLFSYGCWIGVTLLFLLIRSPIGVTVAFALYGVHIASLEPVQRALVAELAPKDLVASTLGGFQMVMGFMSFFASFIAGLLWDRFGLPAPFLLSLVLTVFAGFLLLFLKDGKAKKM